MRQRWADLLFLHWEIEPEAIEATLPPGLDVDLYEGRAYLALVPFRMTGVTPSWFAPVPGLSDMLECNVRTYVRSTSDAMPGVWFYSLDASNAAAVALARATFALPYFFARMRQTITRSAEHTGRRRRQTTYTSVRLHPGAPSGGCRVVYEPDSGVATAKRGSLEEFLIERYLLYSRRGDALCRGRVHHHPYQISTARLLDFDESLIAAAGLVRPEIKPLVHYSRSVIVEVSPLEQPGSLAKPRSRTLAIPTTQPA